MPVVSIPDISENTKIVADTVNLLFNDATTPEASLSVINGLLDWENLDESRVVSAEHTQRGSAITGSGVAGTANLDWRWTWFSNYSSKTDTSFVLGAADPYQFIPGGCKPFFMPWDGVALVHWSIFWWNDQYSGTVPRSDVFLMFDGDRWENHRRAVGMAGTEPNPVGYRTHRCWSGFAVIDADKGWHDVGLALLADSDIRNTRTYSVSIVVLRCKTRT